ncbi:MAG: Hsp20/alpha crystallin family protein [Planctomycetes bacterium]|nr:Hsp20/alpha crystallin family protein [Planctomycetota bacterium]MBI3845674.1 Hsp20/alpha crystallin family protein [Planctomycetota bacterium]
MDEVNPILRVFFLAEDERSGGGCWAPATDVYRTPDGWLVKLELAGVRPEDIEVRLRRGCLTVAGIRRDRHSCAGVQHYRMEIAYSRFEREIELPDELESVRVSIDHDRGMVLVKLEPVSNTGR